MMAKNEALDKESLNKSCANKKNTKKSKLTDIKNMKQLRKAVEWRDLRTLTQGQIVFNLILPYPFLVVALVSAWNSYIFLALGTWFLFFAASFRQAHDGFHNTLGISKKATDRLLSWSSVLIFNNNHAIRQTHIEHHRNPLSESDFEAKFYQLKWWQAILNGTNFWLSLQKHGLQIATDKDKSRIIVDFTLMALSVIWAFAISLMFDINIFLYHIVVMCIGNSLVGFFAGWLVHHDCHEEGIEVDGHEIIARTERNKLINLLTFNLLFHMEHHAFPSIPANNLPKLAERIDEIAPKMTSLRVTPELLNTNNFASKLFMKSHKATNTIAVSRFSYAIKKQQVHLTNRLMSVGSVKNIEMFSDKFDSSKKCPFSKYGLKS